MSALFEVKEEVYAVHACWFEADFGLPGNCCFKALKAGSIVGDDEFGYAFLVWPEYAYFVRFEAYIDSAKQGCGLHATVIWVLHCTNLTF